MKKYRIITILLSIFVVVLFAHSGRTDKYGGHNNRKTGGYHYHNAGRLHHPSNPYQDHNICGICNVAQPKQSYDNQRLNSNRVKHVQDNPISADKAYKYVGEIKTVCGKVESVFYSYRSNGKPTFLNIDKAYPNNEFMIVIWGNNRYKFKPTPKKKYLKKKICVTGKILMYKGTAEIVVTNPSQIEIK